MNSPAKVDFPGEGLAEPTGVWDEASDDVVTQTGIELRIPKAELEKCRNTEIELRYKFADESSMEPCSDPLMTSNLRLAFIVQAHYDTTEVKP
ncbi:hypothetical protein [Pseudomonas sp. Irchel s3b2]|uniref:hypothetical protein n=1 Tax=Pseudomonas sp. Irchel s3b2 TaxID=2009073 RepID=UPI002113C724|nr:hypothetical protein [Pseudomonas sp. Irchel s3b2]